MMLFLWLAPAIAMGIRVHSTPRFSYKEATTFSRLAQIVYCDDSPQVRNWTCKSCVESNITMVPGTVRIIDGGVERANQVMIGRMANRSGCFISVRGSDNAMNWARDIQAMRKRVEWADCQGCYLHEGFLTIWQYMEPKVVPALAEIGCTPGHDNKLEIAGHSLGAAVSQVAMMSLTNLGFQIQKAYTFESPRVGNGKFSDLITTRFGRNFWRITHHLDPVTHVPFQPLGYYHAGTEVYFDENNKYHVCSGREDPQCMNQHWHVVYNSIFHGAGIMHCANEGFGANFNICNPVCSA